jgi:pimeloyl-ACP methyl ester carboxylesterase
MRSGGWAGAILVNLALLSGCAGSRGEVGAGSLEVPEAPARATSLVFCADGAGGFGATTETIREAASASRYPIQVELVDWSHGRGRMLIDHLDHRNILDQGRRLAAQVRAARSRRPNLPVHLVGHSAGCAVVLAAAEQLPPQSLQRVVLLAPSVSSGYDLRPALRGARLGIDAFCSRSDWFVLGLGMRFSGNTDRRWGACAGRVGFKRVGTAPEDEALYARLRQHFWEPSQAKTGHQGGHYGSFEDAFLRAYVLPLLRAPGESATQKTS